MCSSSPGQFGFADLDPEVALERPGVSRRKDEPLPLLEQHVLEILDLPDARLASP